jgi:hypothetical protein
MLNIPKQFKSLEFISPIAWKDIFNIWKKGEAWQEFWKKHWEERGFDSWEEWRKNYAKSLHPEKMEWFLYKINNPLEIFPKIYGVPSRGWVDKAYGGKTTKQLKDIVQSKLFIENDKIKEIKKDFPKNTILTGFIHKNEIILIEGMHRACALASWDKSRKMESNVTIALAEWPDREIPIIGGNYKNK